MSDADYPFEPLPQAHAARDALAGVRVDGGVSLTARRRDDATVIDGLAESGGYRIKFPKRNSPVLEAAIINTGGGVAGGDRLSFRISADPRAHLSISTPSAERIYRSLGSSSDCHVQLDVRAQATVAWLPQATILFSGARLQRKFHADIADDACLLMAEATVFGRVASGEVMGDGLLHDVWRIRRGGRLVFADTTHLDGPLASHLARSAVAASASVVALLVCVAPDAVERCDAVRSAVSDSSDPVGVSAWNGMLVMRIIGHRLDHVQNLLRRAIFALNITPVPQVWPR